ncbi:MAG TPA: DUF2339 domain-containing protein [Gaiellaceae bacterium]|nr:DUF2339 domain-containing protein [Gaiellaceae bacterium]
MTTTEAPTTSGDGNLAAALVIHYGVGFFWLFGLGGIAALAGSTTAGVIWALCAVPLWIADSVRMIRAKTSPGRVWRLTFDWWLKSFVAPLFLVIEIGARLGRPAAPGQAPAAPSPAPPPAASNPQPPNPQPERFMRKLEDFARRLEALEHELADLRRVAAGMPAQPAPAHVPPPPVVPPAPTVPEPPPIPVAAPVAAPVAPPKPPPAPPRPPAEPPEPPWWSGVTFEDLFGAKVLAWVGGLVTLLGVLFFFVLAVNRGWIGPVARVSLGAIASALVFSAGLYVRRRYGHLYYSAYAAAGAGIGGGYATLLAARLQYDLVSDWAALIIAAAIAAVGVATALAWSSELIAGLGLIGATVAPAAVGLQNGELSSAGTAFAALVFAGTAVVALGKRWQVLLAIGVAVTVPQVAVLVGQASPTEWDVVGVAAAFWLLYLASALGLQVRFASPDLAPLPSSLILFSAVVAGGVTTAQFTGRDEGWMLLGVAAVYGAIAAVVFPKRIHRDLSALLAAIGLGLVAVGLADLVSGPTLTIAWAAEAAILAWLARRINEPRYQLASFAYLAAAVLHTILLDAPLHRLYQAGEHPARGGLALVGIALAGSIVTYCCRPWESARASAGILAPLEPMLDAFRRGQALWREVVGWISALAALYAASLGVLGLAEWIAADDVQAAFEWGHVAVIGLWGAVALGTLTAGIVWSQRRLRDGALIWFGAIAAQIGLYIAPTFEPERRGIAFLVGATALLAGTLLDRLGQQEPTGERPADVDVLPGIGIAVAAVTILAFGLADLLSGTVLVLVWAAGAATLAWLARRVGQLRYQVGSFAYLAAALVHALSFDAPLRQLYEASARPAEGVVAFVGVALAGSIVAYYCRSWTATPPPEALIDVEPLLESFRIRQPLWRSIIGWTASVSALYVASLVVLGLAEWISDGDVGPAFQWGHVAVVALWGAVALAVLSSGHRWSLVQLRFGGLVWLAVTLAHALGFFPGSLEGDRRDLGFLVVAAALLAGSLVDRLRRPDRAVFPIIVVYSLFSLGLALAAAPELVAGDTAQGSILLGIAAFYCALGALVFTRDRDFSTLLWAPALLAAVGATDVLVSGTWLVLVWAGLAAALVLVADRAGEKRLQLASFFYLALAAGHAVVLDGPPSDFFESNRHPEGGVLSLVFVACAAWAFAWYCGRATEEEPRAGGNTLSSALLRREPLWRRASLVASTAILMYAASLAILGLAEAIGNGTVAAKFHAGHSAVSALWGLVGLVALYVGLKRRVVWLQAVGFGLFAVSLAKIFLYDLRFLSSVTRALSFLAVGAVLLLGGFFVQKLGSERRDASA